MVFNATGNLKLAVCSAAIGLLSTSVAFVSGVVGGAVKVAEEIKEMTSQNIDEMRGDGTENGKKSVRMTREEIERKRILVNLPVPEGRWN